VRLIGALRARSGAPSGLFAGEIRFPGLKPWVESYSPFVGATNRAKIFLNLAQPFKISCGPSGPKTRLYPRCTRDHALAVCLAQESLKEIVRLKIKKPGLLSRSMAK
jgi:hypothetical protein